MKDIEQLATQFRKAVDAALEDGEFDKYPILKILLCYNSKILIDYEEIQMEQILILEDDTALNQGLCKALKTDSRKLVSCETIKTARDQLLCGCPSLILLDINLPDGSGLDFLQELKRNYPNIPVILLTANDTDMDIVKGLELGAELHHKAFFPVSIKGKGKYST